MSPWLAAIFFILTIVVIVAWVGDHEVHRSKMEELTGERNVLRDQNGRLVRIAEDQQDVLLELKRKLREYEVLEEDEVPL